VTTNQKLEVRVLPGLPPILTQHMVKAAWPPFGVVETP
jgi:hypothetical protein